MREANRSIGLISGVGFQVSGSSEKLGFRARFLHHCKLMRGERSVSGVRFQVSGVSEGWSRLENLAPADCAEDFDSCIPNVGSRVADTRNLTPDA